MKSAAVTASVEGSTLSKSKTSMSCATESQKQLIDGSTSFIDAIFPLIDEIYKKTNIPKWVYYVFVSFFALQITALSLWPGLTWLFHFNASGGQVARIFLEVCMFTDLSGSYEAILMRFIVFAVLAVVFVLIIALQFVIYKKYLMFITWALYIARFIFEFVPLISLCPMGNLFGALFNNIIENRSLSIIIIAIFTVLIYALFVLAHYMSAYFGSMSIYIPNTIIAAWDGILYFAPPVIISAFCFVSYIFQYFSHYMSFFVVGCKIVVSILLIKKFLYFPFIARWMNSFFFAYFIAMIVLDGIYIIQLADIYINYTIQLCSFFGVLAVTFFFVRFIFNKRVRNVVDNLTYEAAYLSDEENQDNFDKGKSPPIELSREHFIKLGLDKDVQKAKMYLRIGIAERSPLFLNWQLAKFIFESYNDTAIRCEIAHMVSFFPSEMRLLSYYMSIVQRIPNLNYEERFMIFELHKVKKIRQSSASTEVTTKVQELKHMSHACFQKITSFWSLSNATPDHLFATQEMTVRADAMFKEAISNWPNNIRLAEEYSTFLIECSTDFIEGVKMKNRANLIELGKNFVIDLCYKSMIRCFPEYLKRNVLDVKGNFVIAKQTTRGSTQSSSKNSTMSTGTIDGELDIELEEQLAKSSFKFHRLRLALQRSLMNRKSKYTPIIKWLHTFALLLLFGIAIFLYVFMYSEFDERSENMQRQLQLNNFRYGFDTAFGTIVAHWSHGLGYIDDDLYEDMKLDGPTNEHNMNLKGDNLDEITKWIDYSKNNLYQFITEMVQLAISGYDVDTVMSNMMHKTTNCYLCQNGKKIEASISDNLKNAFIYLLINMNSLTVEDDINSWGSDDYMCMVINNSPGVIEACRNLAASIAEDQATQKKQTDKTLNIFMIAFSIGYVVLVVPALIYNYSKAFKELNYLIRILQKTDDEQKQEAAAPIKRDAFMDNDSSSESGQVYELRMRTYVFIVIVIVAIALINILGVGFYSKYTNETFLDLNQWMRYGVSRSNYMLEALVGATIYILIGKYNLNPTYTTLEEMKYFTLNATEYLSIQNNKLLRGDGEFPGCVGENEELDALNLNEDCIDTRDEKFHDSYSCSSIDQSISMFIALAKEIIVNVGSEELTANSNFDHLFHIANVHLADKLYQCAEILASLSDQGISDFHIILNVITWCSLAAGVIVFGAYWILAKRIDSAYDGAIQIMRRLPPHAMISNHSLMNYIMNKKDDKKSERMSTSKSVIHLSKNPVACLSRTLTIDVVNNAVTDLFGFTVDQLLGQNINTIVPPEKAEEMYNSIELMLNGQSSLIIEKSVTAVTDNEMEIPVHVTIIGIADGSKEAKSFALVFRDETKLLEQQKNAKDAKEQSEKLLYQILPRDIVSRLNSGETDITFVVPSASIIFIDIVRFSEYSASLSPSQIMENLSTIFAAFDKACSMFNLITKIKLIGDVYMAAAGLFTPDEPVSSHAIQTVNFGLDAIASLEESNILLESSLQVRVGVNTDGPLIAGVLGTDKPVFDIIGDPINVASRLQSTCIPGSVQISQSTYEAIQGQPFSIEARGEINLKGKGKRKAYIVKSVQIPSILSNNGSSVFK